MPLKPAAALGVQEFDAVRWHGAPNALLGRHHLQQVVTILLGMLTAAKKCAWRPCIGDATPDRDSYCSACTIATAIS